jgi:hypothetical protein
LDLTTARADWAAFLIASPTVADVDGDTLPDLVIGTAVGYVYAISNSGARPVGTGTLRERETDREWECPP